MSHSYNLLLNSKVVENLYLNMAHQLIPCFHFQKMSFASVHAVLFVFQSCAVELFVNVHYLNFGGVFTQVYHTVLILYIVCKHTYYHCLNLKPFNSLTEHVCRTSLFNLCISNHKKVMKMETTMAHVWEENKKHCSIPKWTKT